MGLSSIEEAIKDIKSGKFVIVVDDEDRVIICSGALGRGRQTLGALKGRSKRTPLS